jgi:hypothetical protein
VIVEKSDLHTRNKKMSAAKAAKRVLDLEVEDHDVNRTPRKKRKQTLQKYKDSYHDLWPCYVLKILKKEIS